MTITVQKYTKPYLLTTIIHLVILTLIVPPQTKREESKFDTDMAMTKGTINALSDDKIKKEKSKLDNYWDDMFDYPSDSYGIISCILLL